MACGLAAGTLEAVRALPSCHVLECVWLVWVALLHSVREVRNLQMEHAWTTLVGI